jgi:putative membrane protein
MMGFLLRAVISAIGLWLATQWVAGVHVDSVGTLILAGILLGVVNAIVRPIAFILTLPITLLTLGLFLFVLNAAMVWLVAVILPGFHAPWFVPAFLTSIIVWITGWIGSWLIGHRGFERYARR